MKYKIYVGLGGSFGGATFQYVDDFDSEDVRNGRRESFGEEPAKMMLEKDISKK